MKLKLLFGFLLGTSLLIGTAAATTVSGSMDSDQDPSVATSQDGSTIGVDAFIAAQADMFAVQSDASTFAWLPYLSYDAPHLFTVDAEQATAVTPDDSATAPEVQSVDGTSALPSDVAAAVEDVRDQGVTTSTSEHADEAGAQAEASGTAGSHSFDQGVSAPAPVSAPKLAGSGGSGSRFTHDEPTAASDQTAAPGMDPAPAAADGPSGLMSADVATSRPSALPSALQVAATLALASVGGGTLFIFVPGWRTAAWKLAKKVGLVAAFSRIAQEDILSHQRRSELMEFIKHNPGERVEVARKQLGISNGSMHYHLKVLQDRNLVRVLKDGSCARLFPAGPKIVAAPYVPPQRRRLLEILSEQPGLTQRDLATQLELSERMVSYHTQMLATQGLVEVRAEGARKRVFLRCAQPVALPVAA